MPGIHLETWVEGGSGFPSRPETMPDELPLRLEAGTQNSAGVAGLLAGVQFVLEQGVEKIHAHEMRLASQLIEQLQEIPGLSILGPGNLEQRTAVVSVTVDNYIPDQLSAVLDKVFGVATRAGLHCAPQAHHVAGTLENGALRFSPGYFTTAEEIDYAVESLQGYLVGNRMAKQRIEKTLVILNEDELRQVMRLARQGDTDAIYKFVKDVIAKRVEEAIRRRCG